MRFVEVNGVRLSSIGVGCWQFGSSDWGYGNEYGDRTAIDIVHRALDLGVNLDRHGRDLRPRGVGEHRGPGHRRPARRRLPRHQADPDLARRRPHVRARPVVHDAARRRDHRPLPGALPEPCRAGIADHEGDAAPARRRTDPPSRREQLLGRASGRGPRRRWDGRCCRTRCGFSLAQRKPERTSLPYAQASDRLVIAYSPLAQGLLGGRYDAHEPAVEPDSARATRCSFPRTSSGPRH